MGNELYFQKKKDSETHEFMHLLFGTFIEKKEIFEHKFTDSKEKQDIFPLKIVLGPQKTRILYYASEVKRQKWFDVLQKASGNAEIGKFYSFEGNLGKGQFGQVKKAVHVGDKKAYAVKIIKKKKISSSEMSMLRNEIEVLKICEHPYICKLIDVFEDQKCLYVVLELLSGGDMFEYLNRRDFNISESRIRHVFA